MTYGKKISFNEWKNSSLSIHNLTPEQQTIEFLLWQEGPNNPNNTIYFSDVEMIKQVQEIELGREVLNR